MIVVLLLAAAAPADGGPDRDCADPQVQQAMNYCAAQDFHKADAKLNTQWKQTATEMKRRDAEWGDNYDERPGYFDTLLASQRAWLKYRDAQCDMEGYQFRGGTMEPLMVATCRTRLTEQRTMLLHEMIDEEG